LTIIMEKFGCGEDGWWLFPDFIERPKFVFFYSSSKLCTTCGINHILSLYLAVPMYVCSVPLNAKIYSLSSPALYSADLALTMLWPQIRNNGLHHPPLMCLASKISYLNLTLTHSLATICPQLNNDYYIFYSPTFFTLSPNYTCFIHVSIFVYLYSCVYIHLSILANLYVRVSIFVCLHSCVYIRLSIFVYLCS
jgi:hypothetical protein